MVLLKYEALYYILCRVKKVIDYDLRSFQSIKCYFTYMWCYVTYILLWLTLRQAVQTLYLVQYLKCQRTKEEMVDT